MKINKQTKELRYLWFGVAKRSTSFTGKGKGSGHHTVFYALGVWSFRNMNVAAKLRPVPSLILVILTSASLYGFCKCCLHLLIEACLLKQGQNPT